MSDKNNLILQKIREKINKITGDPYIKTDSDSQYIPDSEVVNNSNISDEELKKDILNVGAGTANSDNDEANLFKQIDELDVDLDNSNEERSINSAQFNSQNDAISTDSELDSMSYHSQDPIVENRPQESNSISEADDKNPPIKSDEDNVAAEFSDMNHQNDDLTNDIDNIDDDNDKISIDSELNSVPSDFKNPIIDNKDNDSFNLDSEGGNVEVSDDLLEQINELDIDLGSSDKDVVRESDIDSAKFKSGNEEISIDSELSVTSEAQEKSQESHYISDIDNSNLEANNQTVKDVDPEEKARLDSERIVADIEDKLEQANNFDSNKDIKEPLDLDQSSSSSNNFDIGEKSLDDNLENFNNDKDGVDMSSKIDNLSSDIDGLDPVDNNSGQDSFFENDLPDKQNIDTLSSDNIISSNDSNIDNLSDDISVEDNVEEKFINDSGEELISQNVTSQVSSTIQDFKDSINNKDNAHLIEAKIDLMVRDELKSWLDKNLHSIVDTIVREEIVKLIKNS